MVDSSQSTTRAQVRYANDEELDVIEAAIAEARKSEWNTVEEYSEKVRQKLVEKLGPCEFRPLKGPDLIVTVEKTDDTGRRPLFFVRF